MIKKAIKKQELQKGTITTHKSIQNIKKLKIGYFEKVQMRIEETSKSQDLGDIKRVNKDSR